MQEEHITSKYLIESMIKYFSNVSNRNVDIYSFLVGNNSSFIKDKRLINYVQEHNDKKPKNRLFILLLIDDDGLSFMESKKLISNILTKIKRGFYKSEIPSLLSSYIPGSKYEILSDKPTARLSNYIVFVFNFPDKSSAEFVISTYGLNKNSKLFERNATNYDTIYNHIKYWSEKNKISKYN